MAKLVADAVLDGALNVIKSNCTRMNACSTQPTTYTEGITTYQLSYAPMTATGFTIADDTTGRKVTMAAKAGLTVNNSGTYQHVALTGTVSSTPTLLFVTTGTSQILTAGNTVDYPSWKIGIGDPT